MPRFAVVQFPGTNCERETQRAFHDLLQQPTDVLWHADEVDLAPFDCVVLPGGFAHGDHLRAGAIARFSPIMRSVERYAASGGLVLGICNGFQVLLEAGLLPGAMLRNATLQFRSEWTTLRVERTDTPFTSACTPGQLLRVPIAHGEGNYAAASTEGLDALERRGGVLLRYVDAEGHPTPEANPNGSANNVAGIVNEDGNVFGLMPHPERACEPLLGSDDGMLVLQSIVLWLDRSTTVEPTTARSRQRSRDAALG